MAGRTLYSSEFVSVSADDGGAVATLTLARAPVNSMSLEVWEQLSAGLRAAEADMPRTRALVVASGLRRPLFTAGNDINELYAPRTSEGRYRRFWRAQTGCLVAFLRSPLATVAAIGGHCPAGGCALALCCDRRVMADAPKAAIGLNEVALGIAVPRFWVRRLAQVVGERAAEELCLGGRMVPTAEAAALGLVDEVVPHDSKELDGAARAWAEKQARLSPAARAETKRFVRAPLADAWWAQVDAEAAACWAGLNEEGTVRALGAVLARLSGGKKEGVAAKL